ncbi:MAG: hypothetical protein KJ999_21100 [Gammaproteobacteria bacterium]|nr:hypothetical protein [Gammaproteobacteria bacterium]
MENVLARFAMLGLTFLLVGCGIFPSNWGKLEGRAWCDVRYLDTIEHYQDPSIAGADFRKRLKLSEEGYIYAVAAVMPLQQDNDETDFHFTKPTRLKEVVELRRSLRNGFDAMTFILHKDETPIQTIVSFGGSNQKRDYLLHNLWLFPVQFDDAREYVKEVAANPKTKDLPIIAAGVSLGGGLAVHVKKQESTSKLITQAWAFNPSPRIDAHHLRDENVYLLANQFEILNKIGREHLGATPEHTAIDYRLIESSSIYAHYRWVLTRQILHFADLSLYFKSNRSPALTEPMEILQTQKISERVCTPALKNAIASDRRAWEQKRLHPSNNKVVPQDL